MKTSLTIANNAAHCGIIAQSGLHPGDYSIVVQAADGTKLMTVLDSGDIATCVRDWSKCRFKSTDAVTAGDGTTLFLWDLFEDLPGITYRGRFMYVPESAVEMLHNGLDIYAKNNEYAQMTFVEFYRKMYGDA